MSSEPENKISPDEMTGQNNGNDKTTGHIDRTEADRKIPDDGNLPGIAETDSGEEVSCRERPEKEGAAREIREAIEGIEEISGEKDISGKGVKTEDSDSEGPEPGEPDPEDSDSEGPEPGEPEPGEPDPEDPDFGDAGASTEANESSAEKDEDYSMEKDPVLSRADRKSPFREFVSLAQRIMGLGILVVIGSAIINSAIGIRLVMPLMQKEYLSSGGDHFHTILSALFGQLGLIIILPLLCFGVSWFLEDRAYRLSFGAAIFSELWFFVITLITGSIYQIINDPVFTGARLSFAAIAAILGGMAFNYGQKLSQNEGG